MKKKIFVITAFAIMFVLLLNGSAALANGGSFIPFDITDQTPTAPLANPVPSSYQPRYISGFGSDNLFTVFFEDRDAGYTISYVTTTTGPTGFPASAIPTNIVDTHFVVKDWPITIGVTTYDYRGWGSVGNNLEHRFYVSNDLTNWTLVSTFTIPNAASFTDAHGWVYYGFHDVILLNGTYYAFAESNQSQTMIVRSANGDDVWEAFASVGGQPGWGPLELPSGVSYGWTPSGSFVDLGHDRGYGKPYVDPRDSNFYLAINTAAKPSLPAADLEAAFINPANWTWHDGTTGPASNPILSKTSEHDLREAWVVPNTNPDAPWMIIYDADFGSADGGKALGYATLTPAIPPDFIGPSTTEVIANPNPASISDSIYLTAKIDDTSTGNSNIAAAEYTLYDGVANEVSSGSMSALDGFNSPVEYVEATINLGDFDPPTVPGIYDLCVTGTDEPGNTGLEECTMLVVYDPDGGFVTGGGWIDSPEGAFVGPIGPDYKWDQDFDTDVSGWFDDDDYAGYGFIDWQSDSTAHVEGKLDMDGKYYGPFSRFDGYRDTWSGTWYAEIDVYLDPASLNLGEGFDYSVAATGSDGAHQRDYIFHVTKDTSTGKLLVAGSNNTNFAPREDLDTLANYYEITSAGWYTFQHKFYDAGGYLEVDLNLLDSIGNTLFTENRSDASDTIPDEVGGNRYSWFTHVTVTGGITVDNHQLYQFSPSYPVGKANFGFVAKYNKKTELPEGNTEFVFQAGDINFHSTNYEWLVVNKNDSRAQFKGTGTINGTGEYKFMLWAVDNEPDTFRIKIWHEDGGSEIVVYDNFQDQAIAGGNIVVHTKK